MWIIKKNPEVKFPVAGVATKRVATPTGYYCTSGFLISTCLCVCRLTRVAALKSLPLYSAEGILRTSSLNVVHHGSDGTKFISSTLLGNEAYLTGLFRSQTEYGIEPKSHVMQRRRAPAAG